MPHLIQSHPKQSLVSSTTIRVPRAEGPLPSPKQFDQGTTQRCKATAMRSAEVSLLSMKDL